MNIALVGGIKRLEKHYIKEAALCEIELKVYNKREGRLNARICNTEAIVIFTNKIAHKTKSEVMRIAKARSIPVYLFHSCGVCTLRDCLNCIAKERKVSGR